MENLLTTALRHLKDGDNMVLVSIVESSGSTPRSEGARMIVWPNGKSAGTIGGGAVEFEATKEAVKIFSKDNKAKYIKQYNLNTDEVENLGMVCGGEVNVEFEFLNGDDKIQQDKFSKFVKEVLDTGDNGKVFVFGAGHVAKEVVMVLSHLDFECEVLDDRVEYANKENFPDAAKIHICDLEIIGKSVNITQNDYVIIMTRGHQFDYIVQEQALKCKPYYLGVMGSKKKVAFVTEKLKNAGFSDEEINKCHMPIGTKIDAETPAELAISVAGELIQMRAQKSKR